LQPEPVPLLSDRQIRILQLVSEGHCHKAIEALVHRSRQTVEMDMRIARGVLQARNTTHAACIAIKTGIIPGPKIG
jgi:DNA-binding NarL/FixJ family response regulator